MHEVKDIVPQMFVVSCIIVDLVIKVLRKIINHFLQFFLERLFADGKKGISHVETSVKFNMIIGHFAPFMMRARI